MKILRGDLHRTEEPQFFRETLFDNGITDLGNVQTPVETEVVVQPKGEDYLLSGTVRTSLSLTCDRCLEEAAYPLEGDLNVWLAIEARPDLDPREGDVVILAPQQREVDLSRVIADSIYLELPQKTLCREDCRGLCPSCGVNLNKEQCGCESEGMDERWSALMKIKQQLENK